MQTIDMTTDPITLSDPADWIECENERPTMPASEAERLRRIVALALAAPLVEHGRGGTLEDTAAHRALERLLWTLVANIGTPADDDFEGESATDTTDAEFDAGTEGLVLDGAAVCGSATVTALARLGQPRRFRRADATTLVVVHDAAGFRFVQALPGHYCHTSNHALPTVPIATSPAATPRALVDAMREHFARLDLLTSWSAMDERDGEPGMFRCYPGAANDNPLRPDEMVVGLERRNGSATLTVCRDSEDFARVADLSVVERDGLYRLTHGPSGARFDVAEANRYVHGGDVYLAAMDLAGAELLESTTQAERARYRAA